MMRCEECGRPSARLYVGRCLICADSKYESHPAPVSLDAGEDSFDDRSDELLDPLDVNGRWATEGFVDMLRRH